MGGWSVARSDSPSCLLKQAPGLPPAQGMVPVTRSQTVSLPHQNYDTYFSSGGGGGGELKLKYIKKKTHIGQGPYMGQM